MPGDQRRVAASRVPFSTKLLGSSYDPSPEGPFPTNILPALTRTREHLLLIPGTADNLLAFLHRELSVQRLEDIVGLLWIVGWPTGPRPLSHQQALSRSIVPSLQIDLHLVWCKGRIFIKPLPAYLLDPQFWTTYLDESDASLRPLARSARGFLLSYCALITTECDFRIAQQSLLLPEGITWRDWITWSQQVVVHCDRRECSLRWHYGELRLARLNQIYRFRKGHLLRGYSNIAAPSDYREFLSDNFAVLTSFTIYVALVLTAMQVGLATNLQRSVAFQNVSYGFTIFAIITPLVTVGAIIGGFLVIFIGNWVAVRRSEQRRLQDLGLDGQKTPA